MGEQYAKDLDEITCTDVKISLNLNRGISSTSSTAILFSMRIPRLDVKHDSYQSSIRETGFR